MSFLWIAMSGTPKTQANVPIKGTKQTQPQEPRKVCCKQIKNQLLSEFKHPTNTDDAQQTF